jgi:uncharacterized protein (DUF1778 family)
LARRYGRTLALSGIARFDLKLQADEKAEVAPAAALMGTSMAGFVRAAAKEKAQALVERETRLTLSPRHGVKSPLSLCWSR